MSFRNVLVDIKKGLGMAQTVEQDIAPFVDTVYPPAAAVVSVADAAIRGAELLLPDTKDANPQKKQNVMSELGLALPMLQAGLQVAGIKFEVTPQAEQVFSDTVDHIVLLYNDIAKIKALIEGVPIVAAPVAPAAAAV